MTDLVVKAAYASVVVVDGLRLVGFVDARDEAYALFRQPVGLPNAALVSILMA